MFNRFSSLKTLNTLKPFRVKTQATGPYPHTTPKNYITATVDDLSPSRRAASLLKQETFGQQLVRKNQERVKKLVKEFVHMVVHGSKSAYKDAKYLASVVSSKPKKSYTVEEIREVKRVTKDLIKFVPFYAAIIIPAGEIALLPYLFFFPRAIPSYFMSDMAVQEVRYKYIDNQAKAQEFLREHLWSVMTKAGYDLSNKDPEDVMKIFVDNKDTLMPLLRLDQMDSEILKNASDFLMFEYIDGTNIINTVYKTFVNLPRHTINLTMWALKNNYRAVWNNPIVNYDIKMNGFGFEGFKKQLIKHQFMKQLKVMKTQNFAMISRFFGKLGEEAMINVAKVRGYDASKEEEAKKWIKEQWNPVAKTHLSDEVFLFWYSIILYESHH